MKQINRAKSWRQNEFEVKFVANAWPEQNKAALLSVHLAGNDRFIFNGLDADVKQDYARLVVGLDAALMTEDRKRYLSEQYDVRAQGGAESVAGYARALTELAHPALSYMTVAAEQQTNLRNKFIAGLIPQIREEVKVMGPKTMTEAILAAERIETKIAATSGVVAALATISKQLNELEPRSHDQIPSPANFPANDGWINELADRIATLETVQHGNSTAYRPQTNSRQWDSSASRTSRGQFGDRYGSNRGIAMEAIEIQELIFVVRRHPCSTDNDTH